MKKKEREKRFWKGYYRAQAVGLPKGKTPSHRGYPRNHPKMATRCSVCAGSGKVPSLTGFDTCAKCEGVGWFK